MSTNENNSQGSAKRLKRVRKADGVRYHCNYCGKDISNIVRIKCAVCQDFDLCLQCFSVGVEISNHKSNHDYHVMDALNFPLFEEEWGADEELLLLEGIEMYGLGNWIDVGDHVGTKLPLQCKEHYFNLYIDVPSNPYPDMTRILTTTESLQQRNKNQTIENDHDIWDDLEDDKEDKKGKKQEEEITQGGTAVGYNFPEFAGFMPLRGDFETEYENDGECILADMAFNDEDSTQEVDLKLKIIEGYNKKLDERIKRKAFILEYGLLEYKKKERKKSKEEKEIYDRLRPYLRILGKQNHEQLITSILAEKQIRRRIEELKKYRKLGLHNLSDITEYEDEKKRLREGDANKKIQHGNVNGNYMNERVIGRGRWMNREGLVKWQEKHTKPKIRKPGLPLDISGSTGIELITDKEKELCSSIRLFPQQYLLIKETLIRESIRLGHLKKGIARQLIKIDVNKTSRIFDFFETCGWINKTPRSNNDSLPPVVHSTTTTTNSIPPTVQ